MAAKPYREFHREIKRSIGLFEYLSWNGEKFVPNPDGDLLSGKVITPLGIVLVHQSPRLHLDLSFICNGYRYNRIFERAYPVKYIVTLANRFAAECQALEIPKP